MLLEEEEEEVDLVEEDLEDIFGCGLERKARGRDVLEVLGGFQFFGPK